MRRNITLALAGFFILFSAGAVPAESTNLIRNGSFEEGAASGHATEAKHWKMGGPDVHGDMWGSASRENWRAFEGEFIGAVRGLWADCGTYGGWWQETKATPGTTYRASGWFFSDPEWIARTQEIKIEFWDKDYTSVLHARTKPIICNEINWLKTSIEALAPAESVWVRLVVNIINTGASGSLQMDNLELVEISAQK